MTLATTTSLIHGGNATVFVTDMDRSVDFYSRILGLSILYRAGEHFCMLDAGNGMQIGLHPPGKRTPKPGVDGGTQVGLGITKPIEEVVATLSRNGVAFEQSGGKAVVDDGAVKLAFFRDPDGNLMYLCESKH
jgi:catechol 2,3-dioxygenase-like lactoylglutathione lyase family enzyme